MNYTTDASISSYATRLPVQDPDAKNMMDRPSSSGRKPQKAAAKANPKVVGEVKDILHLAEEFKEIVSQMAFEKFDFHQWFRYVDKI